MPEENSPETEEVAAVSPSTAPVEQQSANDNKRQSFLTKLFGGNSTTTTTGANKKKVGGGETNTAENKGNTMHQIKA